MADPAERAARRFGRLKHLKPVASSLGWAIGESDGRKLMAFGGANTVAYWRFPEQHVAIVVLTNLQGSDPHGLAGEIARRYFSSRSAP